MAIEKTNIKDIIDKNYAEFDLGLLCEDKYKSLKHIDMVVYTLLNNQHGLSVKTTLNGSKRFVDKNGYVFISIGQDKLCKLLRTTRPTLNASLKRLEEVGLVEVINTGNMKCNRIYVGKLKRTITLGDYMKDMNISSEENEFIPSIDIETIEEIKENKKASTVPPVKAEDLKNNDFNNIIPQNNSNDTKKEEDLEIINLIKESCINVKKADLIKYKDEFADINRFKEAIAICESRNSHGIKALRLAYKYGDNDNKKDNKKQSTIFMADSQVDINGKLKSVTEMTDKEIEEKINQKWGWTF